ncbi:MAG: hypothetical protein Q7R30_04015 [Acidobacteriota bacterium]|nr:hypothetical protein [Acidobacteriota bacterium]
MSKLRTILLLLASMAIAAAIGSQGFGPDPLDDRNQAAAHWTN